MKLQKQLNLKMRFSAKYAYKRYLKNDSFEGQTSSGWTTKLPKKIRKKLIGAVLKDPKFLLQRIRVTHYAEVVMYDVWKLYKRSVRR